MIKPFHLVSAFVVAVLLHLSFLLPFLQVDQADGAQDVGEEGIVVGVGLAGTFVQSSSQPTAAAPEEHREEESAEEVFEEEAVEPEVDSQEDLVTAEAIDQVDPLLPVVTPKDQKKTQPQPEREVIRVEKPDVPTKPVEKVTAVATDQLSPEAVETEQASVATQQATGVGEQVHSGGNPAAQQSYFSRIKARLSKYKRYPRKARSQGITGTALVSFVIQKNGKVSLPKLLQSSGHPDLDREALSVLERASPFPTIPDDVSQGPLSLTLPIEFSLNQKRKLF